MNDEHDRDPARHARRIERLKRQHRNLNERILKVIASQQKSGRQPAGVSFDQMMADLRRAG